MSVLHGDCLAFVSCDFEDGVGVVVLPLVLAAGDGFDSAVGPGGNVPELIDGLSAYLAVKLGRNHNQIYIAQFIRPACYLRAEYNAKRD